ncbi:hypothetical protein LXD80_12535 [Enterobacter sp. ASE]|uniref:hypothetical protein n=1 Tax=Enterobacter sp. ASE TaxID=2905968 RepID=UPI001E5D051A|nr:hypothetical protein [Enterobacter sp. ASE]MCE3116621.1 hypothetical protein [Enterobacter sp. ASE]
MKEITLSQVRQHATLMVRSLHIITTCLLFLAGAFWFSNQRDENITSNSYHGTWIADNKNESKTVRAIVSFEEGYESVWIKLARTKETQGDAKGNIDSRLIKMNTWEFLHQTLVMAEIGRIEEVQEDNLEYSDLKGVLTVGTHYEDGHLTLIMDQAEVFGGASEKMVFIMSRDR